MKFNRIVFSTAAKLLSMVVVVGVLFTGLVQAQNENSRSGRAKPGTTRTESKDEAPMNTVGRPPGTGWFQEMMTINWRQAMLSR